MAEGVVGAVLGGESEGEGGEAAGAAGLDPAAAAGAMIAAERDPALAEKAGAYFDKQARLVEIQIEHLHEQGAFSLSHLKARRLGEWLKVGTQVFVILIATGLGLGLLSMLNDAITSRSVIVEPFGAPAGHGRPRADRKGHRQRGAGDLSRLQAATHIAAAKRHVNSDWTSDIKVEIPETGVSIGEIERLLHKRFGHDLHIGGDLVQTETGGLTLSVHGDGVAPNTFAGAAGDFDKLAVQAAEYVYGQSQPGLFARYLTDEGRNDEAIAFAKSHMPEASRDDQPFLLNAWGNSILAKGEPGASARALPFYQEAVRIKPDYWTGYFNVMNTMMGSGNEEGAVQVGAR